MKKIFVIFTIALLSVSSGCVKHSSKFYPSNNSESYENTVKFSYNENWIEENNLQDMIIKTKTKINLTENSTYTSKQNFVYIFNEYVHKEDIYHYSYLAVETNEKVLFMPLDGCFSEMLYLADIDGDKQDEIIIQQTTGMSGGNGQYRSQIFKIHYNEIYKIFCSSVEEKYDTGFQSSLVDGFGIEISNRFIDYSVTLDFSKEQKYLGKYFDESGKAIGNAFIFCDSFQEFYPIDIDNDLVYEIMCSQYVSLEGHSDYIGDAKCVLKYDIATRAFNVIKTDFVKNNTR